MRDGIIKAAIIGVVVILYLWCILPKFQAALGPSPFNALTEGEHEGNH
jgi:hypothetical protein